MSVSLRHVISASHPHSRLLASAFECRPAGADGWALALTLFQNAAIAVDTSIVRIAHIADSDSGRFRACLASGGTRAILTRDSAVASKLGIRGTPTVFLDGIRLNGLPQRDSLAKYLKASEQ